MPTARRPSSDLELLWRLRFGEPPAVRAGPEQTRRVLDDYAHLPAPRLCAEAVALERDGAAACLELRDVRARSQRLVDEARALAGLRP